MSILIGFIAGLATVTLKKERDKDKDKEAK